jgi:DNA segregation ATPase FtsK/SpoIIIE-like protein
MAPLANPDARAAANAAFRFLSEVFPVPGHQTWTLAMGRREVTVRAGTQQAIDELVKNIRNPAGCAVVTKGLQHTSHVAIETHSTNLRGGLPAPIARVQAGRMISMLWRLRAPIDISRAKEVARDITQAIGGQDIGTEFPLPGSIRNGLTVRQAGEINVRSLTYPTKFIIRREKPVLSVNVDDPTLAKKAGELLLALSSFGVDAHVKSAFKGPMLTRIEVEPGDGVKASRIIDLAGDIARKLRVDSVRITPSSAGTIGVEIKNESPSPVLLVDALKSDVFQNAKYALPLALGRATDGNLVVADLAKLPHLLMAGTTGSGKTVGLFSLILSLTYARSPSELGLIMIDLKNELSLFNGIPYLIRPVARNRQDASIYLSEAIEEMERRYELMEGARNIDIYNKRAAKPLPRCVIIVDEFALLVASKGNSVKEAINVLAAASRAAGIHIVLTTQRPSVDVVDGVIKANFPARVAYMTTSQIDSRTILDEGGAETLFGQGDMLYREPGGKITRVHGCFMSDDDVEEVVRRMKGKRGPAYEFGSPGALPETSRSRLTSLSAAVVETDETGSDETGRERVIRLLSRGALGTRELTDRAGVSRARLRQFRDEGLVTSTDSDGREQVWSLAKPARG